MNKERAKKIGAVYYKELSAKFKPGDVAVNAATGEVIKLPSDTKKFAKFCRGVYDGYYISLNENKQTSEALRVEAEVIRLKSELSKFEKLREKIRENMVSKVIKTGREIVCLFITAKTDRVLDPDKISEILGKDRLLSLGRRYKNSDSSLWIALVETNGFVDSGQTYQRWEGLTNYIKEDTEIYRQRYGYNLSPLNSTGYRPGDAFPNSVELLLVNNGEKLEKPIDVAAIRAKARAKAVAKRKREEKKMWDNVKTYDDAKEQLTNTQIFVYKNKLGMMSHPKADGIVAHPGKSSLGIVIDAASCAITPEAKKMIESKARRESGSFAALQLTGTHVGWLGGYHIAFEPDDIEIGRDCDKSTLDKMKLVETKDMLFPKSFVEYVNNADKHDN